MTESLSTVFEGEVLKMNLNDGDLVILKVPVEVMADNMEIRQCHDFFMRLRNQIGKKIFFVILQEDMTIEKIKKEDAIELAEEILRGKTE